MDLKADSNERDCGVPGRFSDRATFRRQGGRASGEMPGSSPCRGLTAPGTFRPGGSASRPSRQR